ncbi:hypothetical protein LN042_33345 [Kitasatospora sp. RB6PN24]|uniref:hypothetical protein n=1 Tax=Kitasatospora humi TaxID=2893891 RepID=UPI001E33D8DF|nr:hypothetical protein [Kitasatospora humi]MCC9311893.1 hypothetical protein [Kitasatospora humi]
MTFLLALEPPFKPGLTLSMARSSISFTLISAPDGQTEEDLLDSWITDILTKSPEILAQIRLQEGGLIEIYVLGTGIEEWRHVLDSIEKIGISFSVLNLASGSSVAISDIDLTGNQGHRLTIHTGRLDWSTDFYSTEMVDFQGDPRDVRSNDDLVSIIRFMSVLAEATGKRAILVPETMFPEETSPYLAVVPATTR